MPLPTYHHVCMPVSEQKIYSLREWIHAHFLYFSRPEIPRIQLVDQTDLESAVEKYKGHEGSSTLKVKWQREREDAAVVRKRTFTRHVILIQHIQEEFHRAFAWKLKSLSGKYIPASSFRISKYSAWTLLCNKTQNALLTILTLD